VKFKYIFYLEGEKYEIMYRWRFDPAKVDFSEGDLYILKILYKNDELSLVIDDGVRF
jgi:hypothetical protein